VTAVPAAGVSRAIDTGAPKRDPGVSVSDTDSNAEREIVAARLRENRERRGLLEEKKREIRTELSELLVRGSNIGVDVAEMARLAGISRDTAHRYLREAGRGSVAL
jgi:Fic family protein